MKQGQQESTIKEQAKKKNPEGIWALTANKVEEGTKVSIPEDIQDV